MKAARQTFRLRAGAAEDPVKGSRSETPRLRPLLRAPAWASGGRERRI